MSSELALILATRAIPIIIDLIEGRINSLDRDELLDRLAADRDEALEELKKRVEEDDGGDPERN